MELMKYFYWIKGSSKRLDCMIKSRCFVNMYIKMTLLYTHVPIGTW